MAVHPAVGGGERCGKFYQELVEDLYAFAEHQFRTGRRLKDGASAGEHDQLAAEIFAAAGIVPAIALADAGPECPQALAYLWQWFSELSAGLSSNGFGPAVVTWEALRAWSSFMRLRLEPWEARALVDMGAMRASILMEDTKGDDGGQDQGRQHRARRLVDRR
ncbi:phage tail assembly chaperone [Rhodopseudomonas sp.]|uniref:phage tail assembly chaperone n=1 Tax=Rhodopseudomonas sp. TaxID=1078 RepID=UPI003B3BC525